MINLELSSFAHEAQPCHFKISRYREKIGRFKNHSPVRAVQNHPEPFQQPVADYSVYSRSDLHSALSRKVGQHTFKREAAQCDRLRSTGEVGHFTSQRSSFELEHPFG